MRRSHRCPPLTLIGVPPNIKEHNPNIYAEDLGQTLAGFMIVIPVF